MKNLPTISFLQRKGKAVHKKNTLTNPDRDWTFLLAAAMVTLIAVLLFSYGAFMRYYNLDQEIVNVSTSTPHYQGSLIHEQVERFQKQEAELSMLVAAYGVVATNSPIVSEADVNDEPSSIPDEEATAAF